MNNSMPSSDLRVGFVGLGAMGAPMVRRLLQDGRRVHVTDLNQSAVAQLVEAGALSAPSPAAIADLADIVLTSLPTPPVVEEVAQALSQGSAIRCYVDLSTTGSMTAKRVGEIMAARGIACLDAPVSGGVAGAAAGTLSIMASGTDDAFEMASPVLGCLCQRLVRVGTEVGQAQVVKLANNLMGASNFVAAVESLALCVRAGVAPARALEVFNVSTGRSFATEVAVPRAVTSGAYNIGFRMELMNKDLRLCLQECDALNVPAWQGTATGQLFSFAMSQGMSGQDFSAIARLIGDWAHVDLSEPTAQ